METSNPLLRRNIDLAGYGEETASMNLQGVVNKTGILLLLCLGAAAYSWSQPELAGVFMAVGIIGGLIAFLIGMFSPKATPFAAPAYAVLEGLCLGAVSQLINARFPGIAVNAVFLTFGVLGLMLFLYASRIIRVTNKMAMGVFAATGAIALVYLLDMILGLFHVSVPYLHSSGPIGIGISLVIVGIAAFNLLIDFAVIENNVRQRAPKYMEWYCGMALLVTLVWLYMEVLRLLSKLQSRD